MKLNGSFVLREVAGEWLVIPVGQTALQFDGMIILNPVSRVIWECLQQDTDVDRIVDAVTQRFEIEPAEAKTDVVEFLNHMKKENLIIE